VADAEFSLIRGSDQWQRCSFESASLVEGGVQLAWEDIDPKATADAPESGAGLAFDRHCRLFHSKPEADIIERILWAAEDPVNPQREEKPGIQIFSPEPSPSLGDFEPEKEAGLFREPRALAVDSEDLLYVAEAGSRNILIIDLFSRRLMRRIQLKAIPVDLICDGLRVYVLTQQPAGLMCFTACTLPSFLDFPAGLDKPGRMTLTPCGQPLVLDAAGTDHARVVNASTGQLKFEGDDCRFATDIEFYCPDPAGSPVLVIARRPGEDFKRFVLSMDSVAKIASLSARGYDGYGIVRTPDQRIAYWTDRGVRHAVVARVRYVSSGHVTGFQLDSGSYRTTWGRIFLDACIPRGTSVAIRCLTSDEPAEVGLLERKDPSNMPHPKIPHDDQSPPMPPVSLTIGSHERQALHRRETGPELPWLRRPGDSQSVVYEAPVDAPPGRYLWVVLELSGNSNATPQIYALRAEYPGHDLLKRIPKTLSSEPEATAFLQRYLAPFAGMLGDLDLLSALRHVLLNPDATAEEALPWLAGFLGLVLDQRWSLPAKRQAIREAAWLFKFRGTIPGLKRFIRIVSGVDPILIEMYRLRGGVVIGEPVARSSRSIVGGGFRVGGSVGTAEETTLAAESDDGFDTHAHRFTVMLPGSFRKETLDLIASLLEVHRPAHTMYQMCTVGAGMRVGRGLHVEIASIVGPGSGFSLLHIGGSVLGRNALLGRPALGSGGEDGYFREERDDAVFHGETRIGLNGPQTGRRW
jgi:phage tail-like protein